MAADRSPAVVAVWTPGHFAVFLETIAAHPLSAVFTIFEGTSEIQRMIIGRAGTGLHVLSLTRDITGPER